MGDVKNKKPVGRPRKYKTEKQAMKARSASLKKNYEWKKSNTKSIMVLFYAKSDADVLAKLSEVPNKTAYVRELIRKDIAKEK